MIKGWFNSRQLSLLIKGVFIFIYCGSLPAQEQPISPLVYSFATHTAMKANTTYGLEWFQLGPTLNGARVEAVQADSGHPGTIYVAFGSGGLWKTTNNGLSWVCIFENQPSLGIGDIALSPSHPDILYVGTGESLKKARNFTMPGNGVYRSEDGGKSWSHVGLNDAWHIGEIAIHPANPDIVLVAALGHFWSTNTNRGLFRSEDGGKTWTHVFYMDDITGANDVVFSPVDPNIVYATTWENYPDVHGDKSTVYKSEDGGKSWTERAAGINIDKNTGRMGIAASYQDKHKAYVFVDQRNRGRDQGAGEVYKTMDGGQRWEKTHTGALMSLSTIGWYFMDIYVDPINDEEVYGLGVRLLHSNDGGKTFSNLGGQITHLNPSPAQTLHLDHCEIWINPLNPKELLLGNDGGLYHSYDKGASWVHLNNIPTGEFYDIELDDGDPYLVYGGTQDNSTVFGPAMEWNSKFNDPWQYVWIDAWSGGDGCITLVDPNDDNTLYFSMQNGGARRMDLSADTSVSIRPQFPKEDSIDLQYNFITPYILSPHNSNRVYMAGNYVMRSDNRGDDWSLISPDLIKERNHPQKEIAAGAIAESLFEEGTLYIGTDRGTMWRTRNGGKDWDNISEGLPPNYIRCIYPSKYKKGRVLIQFTGMNYDDFGAYLYMSEDDGDHWKSIVNDLPDQPVNTILEDPVYEDVLYAGTFRGVYVSKNLGINWSYFGSGMPDVSIADIAIEEKTGDMVVATHGRGIYKLNLSPLYVQISEEINSNYFFDIPGAKHPKVRDTHKDIEESSITKVPFTFWLNHAEPVKINMVNAADSLLWNQEIEGRAGFNQFWWNLVIREENSDLPYFIHYQEFLKPGDYTLFLETSTGTFQRPLCVTDGED